VKITWDDIRLQTTAVASLHTHAHTLVIADALQRGRMTARGGGEIDRLETQN